MIDSEIRNLAAREPDHPLERLEQDIWDRLAARERARIAPSRLLALQLALFAVAFGVSATVGYHWAQPNRPPELSVFSPRSPLNASVLLTGEQP